MQWWSCRFRRDSFLIFMPPQHTLQQCFYLFVQASVAYHRYFFSLRKKTERISMKFARGYQYYQHINWLHFGRNWNRNKGLGYGKIFQSMSIGVAAMWNRCWRLGKEFTNSRVHDSLAVVTPVYGKHLQRMSDKCRRGGGITSPRAISSSLVLYSAVLEIRCIYKVNI